METDKISPAAYPEPGLTNSTELIDPPLTTIVAVASDPSADPVFPRTTLR